MVFVFRPTFGPECEAGAAHVHLQYAFADSTNLLIPYSPTLGDRDDLLRKSEKQFEISDESAYSIVPSRMSVSIYTGHTTDSGAPKSEESLVYKPLTFENELFTARVYKRNYRTPALQRLFKGIEQKTPEKTRPRTLAQINAEDPYVSEGESCIIKEMEPTQWQSTEAQSATSVPTGGQPAGDEDTSDEIIRSPNAAPNISIAEACKQGNVEVVETFLKSGGNVHSPVLGESDRFLDLSPIHFASKGGHIQVVEILLSYGADTEILSRVSQERPLHLAVQTGHVAMVQYFLDNGTNVTAPDGMGAQAIHLAAVWGSAEILSLLLGRGAAIDSAMADGAQPLHMASKHRHRVNVIKFLCSQGADIEARTNHGRTPLYYAYLHNAVDNMEALLELGAAHSPQGPSIIETALGRYHAQATRLLLERGLDPNRPVSGRPSALHAVTLRYYQSPEHAEIIELLLVYGADVNLQDSKGDTPLHCLCSHSWIPTKRRRLGIQLANLFLKNMRDVDTVNFAGRTALGVSVEKESSEWLSKPLIDSGSRLLLRRPHLELGLNLHQSSDSDLSYVDCYVRQGSNTSIKELGNYPEDFYDDEFGLRAPMVKLRRLLRDPESLDLNDGSWVSCDGTTPLPHRE